MDKKPIMAIDASAILDRLEEMRFEITSEISGVRKEVADVAMRLDVTDKKADTAIRASHYQDERSGYLLREVCSVATECKRLTHSNETQSSLLTAIREEQVSRRAREDERELVKIEAKKAEAEQFDRLAKRVTIAVGIAGLIGSIAGAGTWFMARAASPSPTTVTVTH